MTNFVAFGTPYVKMNVIYLHVCICIHQRCFCVILCWLYSQNGVSEHLALKSPQCPGTSIDQGTLSLLTWKILCGTGCSQPAEGHLVIAASKYWIPAALSIFWNNLQKTRCLSHSTRNFFCAYLFSYLYLFRKPWITQKHRPCLKCINIPWHHSVWPISI